jgi:chromosomal replication initiator protein
MPHDPQLETVWNAFRARLRAEIPDDVYRVWLEPLEAVALADKTLYVQSPKQTRDWIQRRFGPALSRILATVDATLDRVEIVIEREGAGPAVAALPSKERAPRGLNPAHRFEDFVIGESNRFAHAAALATAELPGQAYNPLYIHGAHGIGKSHLLNAIGNYTVLNDRALEVVYATGEAFTGEFTSAVRSGGMDAFKARYRGADLLILDDVQFIESKRRTAEELLHTFDALLGKGAQLVLAADRAPSALPAFDARLRERFESGLVVELDPPDFDVRLSIVRKRAGKWLSGDDQLAALELLARQVSSSVHALEGALIRVRAYASLTQQPLTTAVVEHVLSNLYTSPALEAGGRPSTEQIQSSTCALLELPPADLTSAKRNRRVVYARQVAMYLCRELTELSLPAIGQRFGGRDHTTVLHAHRQVRTRMLTDTATRELVEKIRNELGVPSQSR